MIYPRRRRVAAVAATLGRCFLCTFAAVAPSGLPATADETGPAGGDGTEQAVRDGAGDLAILVPFNGPWLDEPDDPTPPASPPGPRVPPDNAGGLGFVEQVRSMTDGFDVLVRDFRLDDRDGDREHRAGNGRGKLPSAAEADFIQEVRGAIRRHPSVRSGVLGERQAVEAIDEARSQLFPQVTGSIEGGHTLIESDRRFDDREPSTDAVLSINQLIFDGGAVFDRIDASRSQAKAEEHRSHTIAQEFALRAISAYLDVTRLETQVLIAQDNLARHQLLLERVRERAEGGAGGRADTLRARSRLAEAESRLTTIMGQYDAVIASYLEIFGKRPSHVGLPDLRPPLDGEPEALIERALEENPLLKRLAAETRAAMLQEEAEQATIYPEVSAEVTGRRYDVNRTEVNDHEVTAYLRVSYPFYTGGRIQAQRRRAEYRHAQAKADERSARLEVERQVRSTLTDLEARKQQLESLQFAVQADRETFDTYLELFSVGRRDFTDLLDAQRDLFNNTLAMINTRVELDLARYVLLRHTGRLLGFFDVTELQDDD